MKSLEGMTFMARYAIIIPLGLISSEAAGAGTVIVVTNSCRILAHLSESIACYFWYKGMDISPLVRSCLTISMQLSSPSSTNDNISEVIKTAPCEAKKISPKCFALSSWHLSCPQQHICPAEAKDWLLLTQLTSVGGCPIYTENKRVCTWAYPIVSSRVVTQRRLSCCGHAFSAYYQTFFYLPILELLLMV